MIEVTLPMPANRANARGHWAVHARDKKAYVQSCLPGLHAALGMLCPLDAYTFRKIHISATFYLWALMDADNLTARLKWPFDALVTYRVIPDDKPAHLELGLVTQAVDRKAQRLMLFIEDTP